MVKSTEKRFATCQCPASSEKGYGKDPAARGGRMPEERRDGAGKLLAVTCGRCLLPVFVLCRACEQGTLDGDAHVKESPSCGADIAYKVARAPSVAPRITKASMARTGKLFPDNVLDPGKRGAIHR